PPAGRPARRPRAVGRPRRGGRAPAPPRRRRRPPGSPGSAGSRTRRPWRRWSSGTRGGRPSRPRGPVPFRTRPAGRTALGSRRRWCPRRGGRRPRTPRLPRTRPPSLGPWWFSWGGPPGTGSIVRDEGPDVRALDHAPDVAVLFEVEDQHRDALLLAHRQRRHVHDPEALLQRLVERQPVVPG